METSRHPEAWRIHLKRARVALNLACTADQIIRQEERNRAINFSLHKLQIHNLRLIPDPRGIPPCKSCIYKQASVVTSWASHEVAPYQSSQIPPNHPRGIRPPRRFQITPKSKLYRIALLVNSVLNSKTLECSLCRIPECGFAAGAGVGMTKDVQARADGPGLFEEGGAAETDVEVSSWRCMCDENVARRWYRCTILVPRCFVWGILEAICSLAIVLQKLKRYDLRVSLSYVRNSWSAVDVKLPSAFEA